MNKTKKHIILLGILLFLYSGQIFAHALSSSFIKEQSVQKQSSLSDVFKNSVFLYTVKHPIKEVSKKGTITVDSEEEVEGMTSKKIEKNKLIFSVFSQLAINSFQNINISMSLYNDIFSNHSYDLLYLLFEVFRI